MMTRCLTFVLVTLALGGTLDAQCVLTGDGSGVQCQTLLAGQTIDAGSVKFGVTGVVTNMQGEQLATFSDERWATTIGDPEVLVRMCLNLVGKDVARMIDTGEYRQ